MSEHATGGAGAYGDLVEGVCVSSARQSDFSRHRAWGLTRSRSYFCLSFCSAMNRLITVNSYTILASIITIAIATKLAVLITALFFQHGEKAPAINGQGKLAER